MYKQKAAYNDGMASRYQAAQTRLREVRGGRAAAGAARASRTSRCGCAAAGPASGRSICERARADRADEAVRPRGLVRRPGRRARLQRLRQVALPAAAGRGGTDPDVEHQPVDDAPIAPVAHTGRARLGARVRPGLVRADPRAPRAGRPHAARDPAGAATSTATGMGREQASRGAGPLRAGARRPSRRFETLSGGQQARFQILLLELSGATLLLLDEPTDNLDLDSAEALEEGAGGVRRHGASRSPTTAGSPAPSTGSWCSAPTARSTSRTSRSGTRAGCSGPGELLRTGAGRSVALTPSVARRVLVRGRLRLSAGRHVRVTGAAESAHWPRTRPIQVPTDHEKAYTVRTYSPKPGDVQRQWHVIDATDVVLGRLATQAAHAAARQAQADLRPARRHRRLRHHHQRRQGRADRQQARAEDGLPPLRLPGRPARDRLRRPARQAPASRRSRRPSRACSRTTRSAGRCSSKLKVYAGPEHPHQAQQPHAVRDHPGRAVARATDPTHRTETARETIRG